MQAARRLDPRQGPAGARRRRQPRGAARRRGRQDVFKPTVTGTYFFASQTFAMYKHGETATPDFSDIDKQIEGTAIHEIARGIFQYAEADFVKPFDYWLDEDAKSGRAGAEPPPTKYGQTSAGEDIAECAMLYFLGRPRREKDCPLRCAFMDKLSTAGSRSR